MLNPSNIVWKATVTTLFLVTNSMTQETTTISPDIVCKHPTYVPRPMAPDVRAVSPFYVVAITRTKKTEEIDNVCYTYFEDTDPFLHIISVVYRDGSNSQTVLNKHDIDGFQGIAVAKGKSVLYHDYTLVPVCNQTVFPLYRCFIKGGSRHLDIGPVFGVDSRVVLAADPDISPDCVGEIARTLFDTSELSGRQFLFLPNLLPFKCVTTYTTPRGTIQSIGAERARATLISSIKDHQ